MLNNVVLILSFVFLTIAPAYAASPEETNSVLSESNSLQNTASFPTQDSLFALVKLPLGVSIKVPKNWRLLDGELNTTIETAGEAILNLAGVELSQGKKVNLFRANSNPSTTYAGIAINATDSEMSSSELLASDENDLQEQGKLLHQMLDKGLALQNLRVIKFDGIRREVIDGNPALVIDYVRSGPQGPVVVQMTRLFLGDKEISLNLSYRQSEAGIWKPIINYMRSTFRVSRTTATNLSSLKPSLTSSENDALTSKAIVAIREANIVREFEDKLNKTSIRYTSEEDGFSVSFPALPVVTTVRPANDIIRNYQATSSDGLSQYNVFFNIYNKKILSSSDINSQLDAYVAGRLFVGEQPELLKNQHTTYKNYEAIEFEYIDKLSSLQIIHKGLAFGVDGDIISISLVFPKEISPDYTFESFVSSFELTALKPVLAQDYYEHASTGLRIKPPADMYVFKTDNHSTGLIVIFSNSSGHSLGIFNVSALYPHMTMEDIQNELRGIPKDNDECYRKTIVDATGIQTTQLMKYIERQSKIFMVQGYAPKRTFFRSEYKFKESIKTLTFDRKP